METERKIATLKAEFDRRLNDHHERLKQTKLEHQNAMDQMKRQLELQMTENAKLKVQVIDFSKTIENFQRKDQIINVK